MAQARTQTDVNEFLGELGAGVFIEKLAHSLSEAALGTVVNGNGKKKGKVSLEFTFAQMGENAQVVVSHKITNTVPTKRGKRSEEDITDSHMFVGKNGVLTATAPKEEMTGQFGLKAQTDGATPIR